MSIQLFSLCCDIRIPCPVYHVGENGWTKVWSGDTTEMYYGYYPVETKIAGAEETKMEA